MNNYANPPCEPYDWRQGIYNIKRFDITRRDIIFSVILLLVSLLMSFIGIAGGFKSGFYVTLILFSAAATAYLFPKHRKTGAFPLCCMILSLLVGLSLVLTTNVPVIMLSIISFIILNFTWLFSLVSESEEKGDLGIIKNIFKPFINGIIYNMEPTVLSLISVGKKRQLTNILIGLASAIPVVSVIVPLLMSSDEAFSGMMELLFGNFLITVIKFVIGIVIALILISYCFTLSKDELPKEVESDFKGVENIVLTSFLSAVAVCYLAYMFSQFAYFFSAFSGFLPDGYKFTVAVYARRGFFEMSMIAGINFLLIFAAILISKKNNGKSCIPVRIICCFIAVFTLIIIATAISKMFLYISCFGMTRLRMVTSAFMIFLCIVFFALIIRIFLPKVRVLRVAFISSALVLIVLGCVNVNSFVAKYNYTSYKNRDLKEIDIKTIYDLGYEGVPYLIKLSSDENEQVAYDANQQLYRVLNERGFIKISENDGNYKIKYNFDGINNPFNFCLPESVALKELKVYVKNNADDLLEQYKKEKTYYTDTDYLY